MTHDQPNRPRQPLDPFEEELRRFLADDANEPAPERLVGQVNAIPQTVRPGISGVAQVRARLSSGPAFRLGVGLAAVAAVAVVLVGGALLIGRPAVQSGGPSSGPDTSSPSFGALGPSPSVEPSASVEPTPSIEPSPSVEPSASAEPSPSIAPAAPGPVGGPVPAHFQPVSATFSSAADGWLLGTATCPAGTCLAIVRTTDGGRTWAGIPTPHVVVGADGSSTPAVSRLRFANQLDGWVSYEALLWSTHDGGTSWHPLTLPGRLPDVWIIALESANGFVHAAYLAGDGAPLTIATSPVASDRWVASQTTVDFGAGPVPQPQIVLKGSAGWLIEVDRAVIAGARLVNGAWEPWQPPCLDTAGPATLAAASASDLVVACDEGVWSTPTGVHFYTSSDGGTTFTPATKKVPLFSVEGVAAPVPGTAFVAGSLSGVGSAIVGSFDGGTAWKAVHVLQGAGSLDLSFASAEEGVSIAIHSDGTSELLMSRDAGRTWATVPIVGG